MKAGIAKSHEMFEKKENIRIGRPSAFYIGIGVSALLVIWTILIRREDTSAAVMTFVFFVYGLTFFILGFSIILSPWKSSALKLADDLWLIAAFGITHGISEWCDMFIRIQPPEEIAYLEIFRLLTLSVSFFFLILFGSRTFVKVSRKYLSLKALPIMLPAAWVIIVASSHDRFLIGDISARYLLGIPGVFLTAIALITFLPELKTAGSAAAAGFLKTAVGALLFFGIFSGVVVPKADYFPASYLNYSMFTQWIGIPVQVFRVFCGLIATYGIVQFLNVFDWEMREMIAEKNRELAAVREELAQKEKFALLGQVAGSMSHELCNPLGVMSNAVYFLKTALTDADPTTREYLDIIAYEIKGAEGIVSALLNSVRTRSPQPETVDVAQLIRQTLQQRAIPERVTVAVEASGALPAVAADPQQLQQALQKLIRNGIDAMTLDGRLTIAAVADLPTGTVRVSVRDTGTGIAPEQMTHLFQPLYTTKARGIGLGLVVCKNLVEANGGRIEVESRVGEGSVFTVTLPVERSEL